MKPTVEFLYDFVSTPTYLAWRRIGEIAAACGAEVTMTPIFCAGLFKAIGNPGPLAVPAKRAWFARDLRLWARKFGIALADNPHLPIRTLPLMRGVLLAEERGEAERYIRAVFEAINVAGLNMSDPQVVAAAMRAAEFDWDAYLDGIEREDIKARLAASTQRAIERGAFGVPTFFVGEEMFFGQDRLEFVREALRAT